VNVTNGAMRSAQANVKTGLSSPAVTGSSRVIIWHFFQILAFSFVKLAITVTCFSSNNFIFPTLHYNNETCLKML
jgi:hypothetical protein